MYASDNMTVQYTTRLNSMGSKGNINHEKQFHAVVIKQIRSFKLAKDDKDTISMSLNI